MSGNVHAVTRLDAHVGVWRIFTNQPTEDDPNLMRAIAELAEGMLSVKRAALAEPDNGDQRAFSVPISDPGAAPLIDSLT